MLNMKGVFCAHAMLQGGVLSIDFGGNAHGGWKVVDKHNKKNRTKIRALRDTTGDSLACTPTWQIQCEQKFDVRINSWSAI